MAKPISSIQPRKQRKAAMEAHLHQRHKFLSAHLSENLLVKYNRRSFPLVRGDTVKVMRGMFRGHEEKIASVDTVLGLVTVEGVTLTKADGTKKARGVDPSNLVIVRLNLTDPLRRERLARTAKVDDATKAKLKKELEEEAEAQKGEIEEFKKTLAEREQAEKEKRRADEGDLTAQVDPVTQEPRLTPKKDAEHEHAGGEHLDESREATQADAAKTAAGTSEEKKPADAKKADATKKDDGSGASSPQASASEEKKPADAKKAEATKQDDEPKEAEN